MPGYGGFTVLSTVGPQFPNWTSGRQYKKDKGWTDVEFPFQKNSSATLIYLHYARKRGWFSSPLHAPLHSVYVLLHTPDFPLLIQLPNLPCLPASRHSIIFKFLFSFGLVFRQSTPLVSRLTSVLRSGQCHGTRPTYPVI